MIQSTRCDSLDSLDFCDSFVLFIIAFLPFFFFFFFSPPVSFSDLKVSSWFLERSQEHLSLVQVPTPHHTP